MKITKVGNSFTIENEGNITQHALNSVTAYIGQSRDSITFKNAGENLGSAPITAITVNDIPMTTENIEELLSDIFATNASSSSAAEIANSSYTKVEYSEPLEFPTPTRTGHIAEFYIGAELQRVYYWNGWKWMLLGAEPNLIFTNMETMQSSFSEDVLFLDKNGTQYKVALEKDSEYPQVQVFASKLDLISKDYTLGSIMISPLREDTLVDAANFKTLDLRVEINEYDTNYFKELVTLSNITVGTSCTASISSKKSIIEGVTGNASAFLYSVNGEELTLKNSVADQIRFTCFQLDKSKPTSSIINIADNIASISNSSLVVSIQGEYVDESSVEYDISIKNNSNLTDLEITTITQGSKIIAFDAVFDPNLANVTVSDVEFTQQAFDSFINALLTAPQTNTSRNLSLQAVIPAIANDKKVALISAGWRVV